MAAVEDIVKAQPEETKKEETAAAQAVEVPVEEELKDEVADSVNTA